MARGLVSIVDDDTSVRESLPDLLESFGLKARPFASAEEFLASDSIESTDCLILDVAMPGMSGPQLQARLASLGHEVPVVFITAHSADILGPARHARGTIACLVKPFSETALLNAVRAALHIG